MQPPDLPVAPKILHPAPQNPPSGLHHLHRAHKLSSISSFITKRGKSALLPFPSLLLPHTALPRTDFLFSPSLCLIPMSWSYLDQSRSIYAQWARGPSGLQKNEKGKGKGVEEQDLGSEREREWNSGNDVRRKAYLLTVISECKITEYNTI